MSCAHIKWFRSRNVQVSKIELVMVRQSTEWKEQDCDWCYENKISIGIKVRTFGF